MTVQTLDRSQLSSTTRPRSPQKSSRTPPLNTGDRLSRAEFERRYQAHPEIAKAELIEGMVQLHPLWASGNIASRIAISLAGLACIVPQHLASAAVTMPPYAWITKTWFSPMPFYAWSRLWAAALGSPKTIILQARRS